MCVKAKQSEEEESRSIWLLLFLNLFLFLVSLFLSQREWTSVDGWLTVGGRS